VARKPHGGETVWRVESDGVADSLAQTLGGSSLRRSLRRDHGSSSSNRAAAFEDAELRRLAALPADSVQCPFCKSYFSLSLETCPVCSQPYPRPMRGRGREKRTTIATGRPQSVTPQKFGSSIPKPPAPWRARLGVVVIEGHEEGSITEMDDEGALVQFVTYRQRYRWLEFIHIKDVGRVPLRR
jgi:hypothetical protein